MEGKRPAHKVAEARVGYGAVPPIPLALWKGAKSRLSSKNQVTIPTAICRALDMRPGDEIDMWVHKGMLVMERLPRTPEEWVETTAGAMSHVEEWDTDEKVDAWTRAIREEWNRE